MQKYIHTRVEKPYVGVIESSDFRHGSRLVQGAVDHRLGCLVILDFPKHSPTSLYDAVGLPTQPKPKPIHVPGRYMSRDYCMNLST
jgi:hypothetical protein